VGAAARGRDWVPCTTAGAALARLADARAAGKGGDTAAEAFTGAAASTVGASAGRPGRAVATPAGEEAPGRAEAKGS